MVFSMVVFSPSSQESHNYLLKWPYIGINISDLLFISKPYFSKLKSTFWTLIWQFFFHSSFCLVIFTGLEKEVLILSIASKKSICSILQFNLSWHTFLILFMNDLCMYAFRKNLFQTLNILLLIEIGNKLSFSSFTRWILWPRVPTQARLITSDCINSQLHFWVVSLPSRYSWRTISRRGIFTSGYS